MFARSREEQSFAQDRLSSHFSRAGAVSPWLARALYIFLAAGVGIGSVLTGARVLFADAPIGGPSGLLTLYGATAILGVGFAILSQLRAAARTLGQSTEAAKANIVSIAPAAPVSASSAKLEYRPFDAA
jgi:hypothetical protein